MAHLLRKEKQITFVPGHPAVPALPGQPWLPPRTAVETRTVCGWQTTTVASQTWGWYYFPPTDTQAGGYRYVPLDASGNPTSGLMSYSSTYVCNPVQVSVTYPAQPYIAPRAAVAAVASQTLVDLNLGWNAGARSMATLAGSGKVQFKVPPSTIGAVVGLNDAGVDPGYTNIDYAWYLSGGVARVYENGEEKFYTGQYITDDVFAVERLRGVVRYKKNDTTLFVSSTLSSGTMFLDASLYSGDDIVYDPAIADYGVSEATFLPLAGTARGSVKASASYGNAALSPLSGVGGISATMVGQGSHAALEALTTYGFGTTYQQFGISHASFLPLTTQSRVANRSNASLAPLDGLGSNRVYGESEVRLEAMTIFAQGGMPMPQFSIANNAMLYLTGGGSGLSGTIGGSTAELSPLLGLASGDDSLVTLKAYGESRGVFQPLATYASAYEGNNTASMLNRIGMFDLLGVYHEVFVVMNTDMTVSSAFALQTLKDASVQSSLTVTTPHELSTILQALMRTTVLAGFSVPVFDQAHTVWAVNADTGATSQYEQFDFNSFGKLGGKYFGCKTDGLYLMEGDSDSGLPIRASVNLGLHKLGSTALKRINNCYLGVSSTGTMYLKVTVEGNEYIYAARRDDATLRTQRVDVGKGLRATYFQFEIYNSDGCDFDLSTVEFTAATLDRRI